MANGFWNRVFELKWRLGLVVKPYLAQIKHEWIWQRAPGLAHNLSGQLIVSLTSYTARFGNLHLTLRSLINQSIQPDMIVVWLADEDLARLPEKVKALLNERVQVRSVAEDLKVYNKIIPALSQFPEATIVTADDDIFYPPDWLKILVDAVRPELPAIICHRAHRPRFNPLGQLEPYVRWESSLAGPLEDHDLFPTGVGGVLYPPGILPPLTLNTDVFTKHSPRNDDVWLYFMGRQVGVTYRLTDMGFHPLDWPGSQVINLRATNVKGGGNDQQIRNLEDAIGPAQLTPRFEDRTLGDASRISATTS